MPEKKPDLSRRDFVKTGTLAAATVASFNILASKDAPRTGANHHRVSSAADGRGKGAAENAMRAAKGRQSHRRRGPVRGQYRGAPRGSV